MHLTREKFHVRGVIPVAPANSVEYEQHNLYTAPNQPSLFLVALDWIAGTGLLLGLGLNY